MVSAGLSSLIFTTPDNTYSVSVKLMSMDRPFIRARPFKPRYHMRGMVDRLTATGMRLNRRIVRVFP